MNLNNDIELELCIQSYFHGKRGNEQDEPLLLFKQWPYHWVLLFLGRCLLWAGLHATEETWVCHCLQSADPTWPSASDAQCSLVTLVTWVLRLIYQLSHIPILLQINSESWEAGKCQSSQSENICISIPLNFCSDIVSCFSPFYVSSVHHFLPLTWNTKPGV